MPLSNTGVILEPSATAVATAQQILIDTYGSGVNLAPQSPNGLLVQNIALAITQRESDQADIINSINPNIATGTQLDAIGANLGVLRNPASNSTATIVITGLNGITIPANTQISSTNDDVFLVESNITIVSGGTATGTVAAQQTGAISVAANTINKIINPIAGWSTVNNLTAGVVGQSAESDQDYRVSISEEQAANAVGSINAITAGAYALTPTPNSVFIFNNNTSGLVVENGVPIAANSILLVLDGGGSETTIAEMLYNKLSAGCGMSGNTSYTITIPNTTQNFTATWETATQTPLSLAVRLKLGQVYPPNLTTLIANLVNNNFDFDVLGYPVYATYFIQLLSDNGISPILGLTFGVGATYGLSYYTMPINVSLGTSLLASNVVVTYG